MYNKTNSSSTSSSIELWKGETNLTFLKFCLDKRGHYNNSLVISSVNPELTVKDNTGNVILLKYIEDDDDIYLLPKPFILDIDVNDTEGKKILWGRLFEITFVYYNKETKGYRLDTRLVSPHQTNRNRDRVIQKNKGFDKH